MTSLEKLTLMYRKIYAVKVKLMTRLTGGDFALAEDIIQEAFARAVKYLHLYDERKGLMETWFNAILFNALRDAQKQERNYQELHREIYLFDVFDPAKSILSPEHKEDIYLSIQAISNEKHRRVLELFYLYGYSSKEIAEIEEKMTQSNVTTIVMRFKESLKMDDI